MIKKFLLPLLMIIIVGIVFTVAHGEEDFTKAEELIKKKTPCTGLNDGELEILGDYYMEQMHPGELHEIMDERMGGEGSENLRLIHINMGRVFYCGEHGYMSSDMMGMMMGRNMMNYYAPVKDYSQDSIFSLGYIQIIFTILIFIIIVLVIALLIKNLKNKK